MNCVEKRECEGLQLHRRQYRQASNIHPIWLRPILKGCAGTGSHRLVQGYRLQLAHATRISHVFDTDVVRVEIVPLQRRHRVAQFK